SEFNRRAAVYLSGRELSDLRSDGADFWFLTFNCRFDWTRHFKNSKADRVAMAGYGDCRFRFKLCFCRFSRQQDQSDWCGPDADQYGVLYQFDLLGKAD